MFFTLADGWGKVQGTLESLHQKAMTPAENAYWHREHEESRVFDALWEPATSRSLGKRGWDAFPWWPADPEGRVLAVRVPEKEAETADASNKIACALLLPPISLNQQLFRQIEVVTDGEQTASNRRLMTELRAALNEDACILPSATHHAYCGHVMNAIYQLRNTERFSIDLPYDVSKCNR